ncbi:MAG: MarR family transcriptional regulator [Acidobacteriaceae bacterium]|nr:MarR family transcriptional regulator [Acidobacteriaceae bacterium]
MARLADELKMNRPFSLVEEEAALSILRTADVFQQRMTEVLKPFDLTAAQYNVLRILRGSPDGLPCGHIAERMISRDPDITRLLDRMEARGWISRERSSTDRRVVTARVLPAGLNILEQLDPLIARHLRRYLEALGEKKLRQLIDLMELVRETTKN